MLGMFKGKKKPAIPAEPAKPEKIEEPAAK
jgi:hypothetical protein